MHQISLELKGRALDAIVELAPYEIVHGNEPGSLYLDLPGLLGDPEATALSRDLAAQALQTKGLPQPWRYSLLCAALQYLLECRTQTDSQADTACEFTWTSNARYRTSMVAQISGSGDVGEIAGRRPVRDAPWGAHLPAAVARTAAMLQRYLPDPAAPPAAYELVDRDGLIFRLAGQDVEAEIAALEDTEGISEEGEGTTAADIFDEDARREVLIGKYQQCSDDELLATVIDKDFCDGLLPELLIWGMLRYRSEWMHGQRGEPSAV